ncbi:IS3 family transposase [Paenibacillus sp. FSL M8-0334]
MHYTHPKTRLFIADEGFKQSMSRKGNCWDNAPMESFFGRLKDDVDFSDCHTIDEVRVQVKEYISYYNSERYQWTLIRMTLDDFRGHLLASYSSRRFISTRSQFTLALVAVSMIL